MLQELSFAVDQCDHNDEVRSVVITGAGERAFCAGADISSFVNMTPADAVDWAFRGQRVFGQIERLSKPVIAAINGYALGGGLSLL